MANGGASSPLTDVKFWRMAALLVLGLLSTALWRWVDAVEAQGDANATAIEHHDEKAEHSGVAVLRGRVERIERDVRETRASVAEVQGDVGYIKGWVQRQEGREDARREER